MIARWNAKGGLLEWAEQSGSLELLTKTKTKCSKEALDLVERVTTSKNASFLFCSQFVVGCWGFVLRLPNILCDYKRGSQNIIRVLREANTSEVTRVST